MILKNKNGFGLIEVLVFIVVLGIIAATALQWMTASIDDIRRVNTEREMAMIARAIIGDPQISQQGTRSDFGYVGDIGSFPPNLDALYQNPGGYTTWDGPYIEQGFTQNTTGYKLDEWGTAYQYTILSVTSTGGGSNIVNKYAQNSNDYLLNSFEGLVKDAAGNAPGTIWSDSINLEIQIPNGFGGMLTKTYNPNSAGQFILDSLPVGRHSLVLIYTPDGDTLQRFINILPRHKNNDISEYGFAAAYF